MRVTNIVKARVTATLRECVAKANACYPKHTFKMPTVEYKKRGATAGTACDRTYTIDLNSVLLMENIEDFLSRTVIHEFGHLVDGIVNPATRSRGWSRKRSLHGPTWKRIMRMLGGPTSRCHSYDTTNSAVKKRGQAKHVWTCSCGSPAGIMKIGNIRHMKMIAPGSARYWVRGHANHTYTYTGLEGAPVPVSLPKAANAPRPAPKRTKKVTKLDKCRRVWDPELSRDANIVAFIEEGCTPAGAATYYAKIKKEF